MAESGAEIPNQRREIKSMVPVRCSVHKRNFVKNLLETYQKEHSHRVLVHMDVGEIPRRANLLREFLEPRLRGLLCRSQTVRSGEEGKAKDILHMEGLPSLVPLAWKGAIYCSQT